MQYQKIAPYLILAATVVLLSACGRDSKPENSFVTQSRLGGETSVNSQDPGAFSFAASNLDLASKRSFLVGNELFEAPWTIAPASAELRDGVGPLLNVNACQTCHINDGRGHAPQDEHDSAGSMLVRLFRPPQNENETALLLAGLQGNFVDAHYGGQLQDHANPGVAREAQIKIRYHDETVSFDDGFTMTLRRPQLSLVNLNYGPLGENTRFSPRIANAMIGLGLLENISEAHILKNADPEDSNNDGISGEANYVMDVASNTLALGRFGWKAGQPSLRQQSAAAFNGDMGLTTTLFPRENCSDLQVDCAGAMSGVNVGDHVEINDDLLDFVEFYTQHLAVPERRNVEDAEVLAGAELFTRANCQACHKPYFKTQNKRALPALSNQDIYPFTDMLLHDMGADLSDLQQDGSAAPQQETSEFLASSREWRTPALWGIGLSSVVNGEAAFLHDGRARTPMEAVLWHGGEGQAARDVVLTFTAHERAQFEAFLMSL
ncbi:MAG: di-heme oxidoredictase family protein [Bermanella sp.]